MTNHICLQTYLSYPLAQWVRSEADDHGECVSGFIRDLVMAAYIAQDEGRNDTLKDLDKAREIVSWPLSLASGKCCRRYPPGSLQGIG